MTATDTRPDDQCPVCDQHGALALSDGHRFCTHCQTEYDPNDVLPNVVALDPGAPVVAEAPIVMPQQCPYCGQVMTLDAGDIYHCPSEHDDAHVQYYGGAKLRAVPAPDVDIYSPADLADQIERARALLVGAEVVVHDLAQVGTVDRVDGDGYAWVTFGSGFEVACTPDDFSLTEPLPASAVMDDADQIALAVTSWQLVAQIVRAGQMTIGGAGDERTISVPPNGWLPDDQAAIGMIEWGAAYAIATMAMACGITDEQLADIAAGFDKAAADAAEGARE